MNTHRVTIVTTVGTVHTASTTMKHAYILQGDIESKVSQGRTISVQTEACDQHLNILHIVRWWVEEV